MSEPFRRLSPLSARFLSSRSFHSLPEDVRAEERGEASERDERRVSFTLRSLHMPFISLTLGPQPMIHSLRSLRSEDGVG